MFFTKTKLYKKYKRPIDGGKTLNNKRILGDNKTWIGFISMIVISSIVHVIWGEIVRILECSHKSDYYKVKENRIQYNLILGFLNGFIYVASELPNSFLKRRIGIESGKRASGIKGLIFFIIDQIDSIVGIAFVITRVSKSKWKKFIEYVGLGAIVHVSTNYILCKLHVRKSL